MLRDYSLSTFEKLYPHIYKSIIDTAKSEIRNFCISPNMFIFRPLGGIPGMLWFMLYYKLKNGKEVRISYYLKKEN